MIKGKDAGGLWRNPHTRFLICPTRQPTQHTPPPAMKMQQTHAMFLLREPYQRLHTEDFYWGLGPQTPERNHKQRHRNSQVPGEKQETRGDPPSLSPTIHKTDSNESFNSLRAFLCISTREAEAQSSEVLLQCCTSECLSHTRRPDVSIFYICAVD